MTGRIQIKNLVFLTLTVVSVTGLKKILGENNGHARTQLPGSE